MKAETSLLGFCFLIHACISVSVIKMLATEHQFILVCPDGGYSSWYMDSPIDLTQITH
jgi:hypothetical protein